MSTRRFEQLSMHLQRCNESQLTLIQVTDARIASRPLHLLPRHLANSRSTIRSHGDADLHAQALQLNNLYGEMPRPLERSPVRLAHNESIQSTSPGHACKAFHHCACIFNPLSHPFLREPRRSFRPQYPSLLLQLTPWKPAERCRIRTGFDING